MLYYYTITVFSYFKFLDILECISDVSRGISSGNLKLKLGDMGLCCPLNDPQSASDGDARYCSSELISGFDLGTEVQPSKMDLTKADIFSLGASIYELFKGEALAGHSSLIDENGLSEWQALRMCVVDSTVMSRYSPQLTALVKSVRIIYGIYTSTSLQGSLAHNC
jgi:hypothetical protein